MPPEGMKCNDPSYISHVELMTAQEHRKGKIRVPMYRELLESFELIRDPEKLEALIDQNESEKQLIRKANEAERILHDWNKP